MQLDLKRLSYFKAIVEAGSLSEAARRLSVPQPALSYHLRELEADFGAPLLRRSRSGVSATEGGRVLFEHATLIAAQVASAADAMRALRPRVSGAIRLSALPSLAPPLVPLLLRRAALDLPRTAVHVIESNTREARDMLGKGEIDFAIVIADEATPVASRLTDERLLFVMSARHPDAATGPIRLADALAEPLLLPAKGKPVRDLVEAMAAVAGAQVRVVHEIDGPHPRKQAVIHGLARTFLPWIAVRDEALAGELRVREVVDQPLTRFLGLEAGRRADPAAAVALPKMLREILCPMLEFKL